MSLFWKEIILIVAVNVPVCVALILISRRLKETMPTESWIIIAFAVGSMVGAIAKTVKLSLWGWS